MRAFRGSGARAFSIFQTNFIRGRCACFCGSGACIQPRAFSSESGVRVSVGRARALTPRAFFIRERCACFCGSGARTYSSGLFHPRAVRVFLWVGRAHLPLGPFSSESGARVSVGRARALTPRTFFIRERCACFCGSGACTYPSGLFIRERCACFCGSGARIQPRTFLRERCIHFRGSGVCAVSLLYICFEI